MNIQSISKVIYNQNIFKNKTLRYEKEKERN